jgi:hypothetical protein
MHELSNKLNSPKVTMDGSAFYESALVGLHHLMQQRGKPVSHYL